MAEVKEEEQQKKRWNFKNYSFCDWWDTFDYSRPWNWVFYF